MVRILKVALVLVQAFGAPELPEQWTAVAVTLALELPGPV
jgi:hypothetical protein